MPAVTIRLPFPVRGINHSPPYSVQPPGTTPAAVNVRSFDYGEDCARGGSRTGTGKWHSAQVNGTTHQVQDLNSLVELT